MGKLNSSTMLRHTIAIFAALVSLSLASTFPPAQPPNMPCTWTDESIGTSYDLSQLMPFANKDHVATVTDRMVEDKGEYKYSFGVCTTIAPPAACLKADGTTSGGKYWAPAWQAPPEVDGKQDANSCHYIGSIDHTENGNWYDSYTKWSLLDQEDPAAGISIEILGGAHCSDNSQRRLTMGFRCVKHGIESFANQVIDEGTHCSYNITVDSHFACPTQCGFGGGRVACGDHGVCGFDTDMQQSRCFCNSGWTGGGCGEQVQQSKGDMHWYKTIIPRIQAWMRA